MQQSVLITRFTKALTKTRGKLAEHIIMLRYYYGPYYKHLLGVALAQKSVSCIPIRRWVAQALVLQPVCQTQGKMLNPESFHIHQR